MGTATPLTAGKIILLCILISLIACKKDSDNVRTVSDSIFGIYSKSETSGLWWENLLSTTFIKVSPVQSNRIEIITNYNGLYPIYTNVFDSITLHSDNSFTVNQTIQDGQSASGYSKATGHGSFGFKTISLDFLITRDGPIGSDRIKMTNIKKTSD